MKTCQKLLRLCLALAPLALCPDGIAQSPAPLPLTPAITAESHAAESHELRGLWVVRNDLTSPAMIHHVVMMAKTHGFNALFVQIRGRGDAYYNSSLEPRAEALAGQPKSFDPLALIIQEGHANGLQIHAWMNALLVWSKKQKPQSPEQVVNAHPSWLMRDAQGRYQLGPSGQCEGAYLSPANLAARQHIHDVFLDVARRYDVDGIHFDYIRYPDSDYDYSDAALTRFEAEMQPKTTAAQRQELTARQLHDRIVWTQMFPAQWQAFRCRQVTDLVGWISHDIKAIKPEVVVSAAVFADSQDAISARGQDWKTWLRRGYLDAVVPEAYGSDTRTVAAQIADAVACAHAAGRDVYAGLGSWHISAASTAAKIDVARKLGSQGEVLFSYGGITHDGATSQYLSAVQKSCFQHNAALPQMAWLGSPPSALASAGPVDQSESLSNDAEVASR
jgi:uncharacterized lipoprotein YddW (UPF0748 family)